MAAAKIGDRPTSMKAPVSRGPLWILGVVALASLTAVASAHAQAATEYAGASGVGISAISSQPKVFNPGGPAKPNMSLFLAKPAGPPPESANLKWFEQQAGKQGGRLTIDASPAQSRVWIDGKYVGRAPVSVTVPPGKHHITLLGARQENGQRDVDVSAGHEQKLSFDLKETYPTAVSITVFGNQPH